MEAKIYLFLSDFLFTRLIYWGKLTAIDVTKRDPYGTVKNWILADFLWQSASILALK